MGRSVIGEVPAFAGMLLAKRGPFCFMSVFNQKSPLNDGRHRRHYGEAHGPWGRTKSLRKPQVRDRVAETLGLDGILCEINRGTKIPHERVMKSLQLLCEKVKPNFH